MQDTNDVEIEADILNLIHVFIYRAEKLKVANPSKP